MGSHCPFGHLKHKLWSKEKSGVKLKIGNWPNFFVCRQRATYRWKALDEGYKFASKFISIRGLKTKLWALKVVEVPTLGISKLPLGRLGTMWHLDAGPMARHTIYYKGEGDGFPQVQAVVSIVSLSCSWFVCAPKVFKLCTNQLVVWFVQVRVSNWCLSFFLVPISKLQHAPLTPKCYKLGNVPQFLTLLLFSP
jgi:hypothetical protein